MDKHLQFWRDILAGSNGARIAYAEYLEEAQRTNELIRALRAEVPPPLIELTLMQLWRDHNWAEVFGEKQTGGNDQTVILCSPDHTVALTPPTRKDVVAVIAAADGEAGGVSWLGVFLLRDGRFLLASGSCEYTGWDVAGSNRLVVAPTLDILVCRGLEHAERERLRLWCK